MENANPLVIDAEFEELEAPEPAIFDESLGVNDIVYKEAIQGNRWAVINAISTVLKLPKQHVDYLLKTRKPKLCTALCWRAGLSASTCYQIQLHILHLPAKKAIPPEKNKYSLPQEMLEWYYGFIETALYEKFGS